MQVLVAVAEAAAVDDHRVVEQRPVAIGRGFQLLQKVREALDVEAVDLRYLLDLFGVALMVGQAMMAFGDTDFTVGGVVSEFTVSVAASEVRSTSTS